MNEPSASTSYTMKIEELKHENANLKLNLKVLKYVLEGALQMLSENKIKYNAKLIREAAQRAIAEHKKEQP